MFAFAFFSVIQSCSVHVCLTWEAKKENITFKCKVSQLKFKVDFLNPKNEEQGYCISPIPHPECHSSHNVITQNLETNTTVLVIQRHVDNRLNGPWKCYHGTNVDAAFVNVTVIEKGNILICLIKENIVGIFDKTFSKTMLLIFQNQIFKRRNVPEGHSNKIKTKRTTPGLKQEAKTDKKIIIHKTQMKKD